MPRSKRAAAARAKQTIHAVQEDARSDEAPAGAASPTRRLRRASYRSGRRGPRTLARRRTDFERIALHHLAALRNASPRPSSSATDPPCDGSDPADDLRLTPSWALHLLEDEPDHARIQARLRAMLQRLRAIDNHSEGADGAAPEKTPAEGDDLLGLAEALSAERFVSHDSDHVRLLAACAMAEILRISAPDPPVSPHKLNQVCSLFIEQLAVIVSPRDEMEAYRFSLLEQLATVKTFVIFCDDEDIVCDLFACFYAVLRLHHPAKVSQYFADILASMIDEAEELSYAVLDSMLAPLIPGLDYSASATALAERVVRTCSNVIQVPLCSMLNASVRQLRQRQSTTTPEKSGRRKTPVKRKTGAADADSSELSVHHENISELIVEINRIALDILIYVIPSLEDRIRSVDESVRLANVHLLGRLFSSHADMVGTYPALFTDFLARHLDVSPNVRAETCAVLGELMVLHPKHRAALDEILRGRVVDREEVVRMAAVSAIGASVDVASEELLDLLASRLRDRKPSVRNAALGQITSFYSGNPLPKSEKSNSTKGHSNPKSIVDRDDSLKLSAVTCEENDAASKPANVAGTRGQKAEARWRRLTLFPDNLVQANTSLRNAGDDRTAMEIERVIFQRIAGYKGDDVQVARSRLRRFSIFLANLGETSYGKVLALAQERRQACDALMGIVHCRLKQRKSESRKENRRDQDHIASEEITPVTFSKRQTGGGGSVGEASPPEAQELKSHTKVLARLLASDAESVDSIQGLCTSLATAADLRIYEKIAKAVDGNSKNSERSAALQDALARVGSKSPLSSFLEEHVFPKCLPGVFTSLHFAAACKLAVEESDQPAVAMTTSEDVDSSEPGSEFPVALCGVLRYLEMACRHANAILGPNVKDIGDMVRVELCPSNASSEVILAGLKLITHLPEQMLAMPDVQNLRAISEGMLRPVQLFDVEQGARLVKWAMRVLICLNKTCAQSSDTMPALVKGLAGRLNSFSGDAEDAIPFLTALSQVAKHSSSAFKPVALESFDFVRALLCGALNSKVCAALADKQPGGRAKRRRSTVFSRCSPAAAVGMEALYSLADQVQDKSVLCLVGLVHRAVKLLVYALEYVDSTNEELNNVLEALLDIVLAKDGNVFGVSQSQAKSSKERDHEVEHGKHYRPTKKTLSLLCALSRLCAGRGVLYLGRHPKFFRNLSPPILASTVLLAQDGNPDVRLEFVKGVTNMILKKRLPFRWVVALPLMAVEPVRDNLTKVQTFLAVLLRHRRKVFEMARLQGRQASTQLLPESIIPDMVWVLANLPDVEAERSTGFKESEKCLEMLMERLLETNEYAGVLNEYIESLAISQDATGLEDESSHEKTEIIHELSVIASSILKKKQAGKKWSLAEHPGQVLLPKDMFKVMDRNVETSGVKPASLLEVARKYDKSAGQGHPKKERPGEVVTQARFGNRTTPTPSKGENTEGEIASGSLLESPPSPMLEQKSLQSGEGEDPQVSDASKPFVNSPVMQDSKRIKKRLSEDMESRDFQEPKRESPCQEASPVDERAERAPQCTDGENFVELDRAVAGCSSAVSKPSRTSRKRPSEESAERRLRRKMAKAGAEHSSTHQGADGLSSGVNDKDLRKTAIGEDLEICDAARTRVTPSKSQEVAPHEKVPREPRPEEHKLKGTDAEGMDKENLGTSKNSVGRGVAKLHVTEPATIRRSSRNRRKRHL